MEFSSDGQSLLTSSDDKTIKVGLDGVGWNGFWRQCACCVAGKFKIIGELVSRAV